MVEKTGTTTTPTQKEELIKAINDNKGTTNGLLAFIQKYTETAGKNLDMSFDTIEEFQTISNG
jgi:hypothetical protein